MFLVPALFLYFLQLHPYLKWSFADTSLPWCTLHFVCEVYVAMYMYDMIWLRICQQMVWSFRLGYCFVLIYDLFCCGLYSHDLYGTYQDGHGLLSGNFWCLFFWDLIHPLPLSPIFLVQLYFLYLYYTHVHLRLIKVFITCNPYMLWMKLTSINYSLQVTKGSRRLWLQTLGAQHRLFPIHYTNCECYLLCNTTWIR